MVRVAFSSWTKGRMPEARKTVLDNRYDVVRPLGSGGMGEVFLARDRVLGRNVALKVLRTQYAGDREFAERFKREARSVASLSHPNIVQVYDRGETDDGDSYIAMEYISGGTLKERISKDGPLGTAEAAALGAQVAEALGAAHDRSMVHRDVKPQNVLLSEKGDAKVADFGIARASSSVTISRTGSVMGTAGYMSPEQALGKPATPKSDLYSLGVVLYEALTGVLPFTADNPIAVSMKHVNEPLRPPSEIDPTIPGGMNALVVKLMAKDPEDRYGSAEELADDLWRVSRGRPPAAVRVESVASRTRRNTQNAAKPAAPPPSTPTNKMQRSRPAPVRRRRGIPWLIVAVLFFLGALGVLQAVTGQNALNGLFDFSGTNREPPAGPSGPEEVRVPEVAGLTSGEAEQRITEAGLRVGQIASFPSASVAEGSVIASGYSAGKLVPSGTEVNLDVSSGPLAPSSASPSAPAGSSPEPASSAGSSASAQPSGQEDRRAARTPPATQTIPGAGAQNDPPPQGPGSAAPGRDFEDAGGERPAGVGGGRVENSGPGVGIGSGGNSGSGGSSRPGGNSGSGGESESEGD